MAFTDRIVEHPGRVKLTAVSGQTDTYDMTRAEGTVTEEGTPLNAANLNAEISAMISAAVSEIADSMQSGRVRVTVPTAGVTRTVEVTFAKPFLNVPNVVATPITGGPQVCSWAVNNITTTGFTLVFNRTTATDTTLCWFAHV